MARYLKRWNEVMYKKVVTITGKWRRNQRLNMAEAKLSPTFSVSPALIKLNGFAERTYPEMTKKTETAK